MNPQRFAVAALALCSLAYPQSATLRPEVTPEEDPQLRNRAVALLEKAVSLSSPVWPANEAIYRFKVTRPEPGYPADGMLRVAVQRPATRLWTFDYGPYHFVRIRGGINIYTVNTAEAEPAAVTLARKLLPVNLVHFDHDDLIQSIDPEVIDGAEADCIHFLTVSGDRQSANKLCVDSANGWLIYEQLGEVVIKQSAFYPFNNGWLPGRIERWTGPDKVIEIDAHVDVRRPEEFGAGYFEPPSGAVTMHDCNSFQLPVAVSTPQPDVRHASDKVVDVVVHGIVDMAGHPANLTVLDNTHQQLAAEALRLVASWTYQAGRCNYNPTTNRQDFVVHFKGWE